MVADRLMHTLKKCGYKIAILSGGLPYFGNYLKNDLVLQIICMLTELKLLTEALQGKHLGDIVDGKKKQITGGNFWHK